MLKNDKGFVTNCYLQSREGETIFHILEDGTPIAHLDRYAIIPIEEYDKLLKDIANGRSTNH